MKGQLMNYLDNPNYILSGLCQSYENNMKIFLSSLLKIPRICWLTTIFEMKYFLPSYERLSACFTIYYVKYLH